MRSKLERELRAIKQSQAQMANFISIMFNQVQDLMNHLQIITQDGTYQSAARGRGGALRSTGHGRGRGRARARGGSRASNNRVILEEEEFEEVDDLLLAKDYDDDL